MLQLNYYKESKDVLSLVQLSFHMKSLSKSLQLHPLCSPDSKYSLNDNPFPQVEWILRWKDKRMVLTVILQGLL